MIRIKSEEEIEILRENAILVSKTLAEVGKHVAPGVTTMQLDKIAETFIRDNGAEPGFLGYGGFPYTLCLSVNDVVVHGFPSDYKRPSTVELYTRATTVTPRTPSLSGRWTRRPQNS